MDEKLFYESIEKGMQVSPDATDGYIPTVEEMIEAFDVDGISAAEYKDTDFTLTIEEDDLPVRNVSFTGEDILDGLEDMGGTNATLAAAIDDFTEALSAYFNSESIPAATVTTDVTDGQVADLVAANKNGHEPTLGQTEVEENVKAIGVNLKVTDVITINFWFEVSDPAEITSAALNGVDLDLSVPGVLTRRYNGETPTDFWTVSYDCDGADLYTMLSLTVNGGSTEFNACTLTYA